MSGLCLGTVQFGMKYGVNNTLGQPSWEDSFKMLDTAIEQGINVIDTARAYGEAEEILGKYFETQKNQDKVRIISKLRPNVINPNEKDAEGIVRKELEDSLNRMHLQSLDGYLLHTPEYIYRQDILKGLGKVKEEGLVKHIGVSIYDIAEGEEAVKTGVVDYIQLPYSILDQRGVKTGFIEKAKKAGITIYTRSAFLQGLFMMPPEKVPKHLARALPYLNTFEALLEKYQIGRVEALLHFVKQEPGIDYLVFGVDTKEQLLEDIRIYEHATVPKAFINEVKNIFHDVEKSIIFPSLWSNGKKAE